MSSCGVSCSTCSPRASSASATSASSLTEAAPLCCRYASPLSTPLLRKPTPNPRPRPPCTRCGAVPSAADRWWSSNDSRQHNSNSVLHRSWSRLHEITRPQPQLPARFSASRRSLSPSPLDTFFTPSGRIASNNNSPSHTPALPSSTCFYPSSGLLHPSLAPFNLHKARVHRPSGFLLTAFSNATPHTFLQPQALIPTSRPKKH